MIQRTNATNQKNHKAIQKEHFLSRFIPAEGPVAQLVELSLLTRTTRVPPKWNFFRPPLSTQQQLGSWDLRDLTESTLR